MQAMHKTPDAAPRELTVRQQIIEALKDDMLTSKDISKAVGIKEKEVAEHLLHVARSVATEAKATGLKFLTEPSQCLSCGFVFKKRRRLKSPSRCPICRSEEITETRFGLIKRASG